MDGLAVLNRLPSRAGEKRCCFATCGSNEETVSHLLWQCSWPKEVWNFVQLWCDLDLAHVLTISDLFSVSHASFKSALHIKITHAVALSTFWAIWKARNDRSFNNKISSPDVVLEDINTISFLWIKNRGNCSFIKWKYLCSFPFVVP
ncbi:hypothetical protein LXL04_018226 [Taraxacum kok-saghyz]